MRLGIVRKFNKTFFDKKIDFNIIDSWQKDGTFVKVTENNFCLYKKQRKHDLVSTAPKMGVTPTHSLPPPCYDFLDTGRYSEGGIIDVEQVQIDLSHVTQAQRMENFNEKAVLDF